jgi:DNA polymerase-3 subunit alpha
MNFFSGETAAAAPAAPPALPDLEELSSQDLLKFEKELLGFYVSSHPLTDNQEMIDRYTSATTRDAKELPGGAEITFGAMVTRVKNTMTKNGRSAGQPMAMVTFEDLDGQMDGVLFAETYASVKSEYPGLVEADSIVFVRGKVDRRRETPSVIVSEMFPASEAVKRLTNGVALHIEAGRHGPDIISQLKPVLVKHEGGVMVYAQIVMPDAKKVTLRLGRDFGVRADDGIVTELESILGPGCVKLAGPGTHRAKMRAQQQQLFASEEPERPVAAEEQLAAEMDHDELAA